MSTEPAGVAEAHVDTIKDLLDHGAKTGDPESRFGVASEILTYQTGMAHPRRRLVADKGVVKNVVGSVARFVWLVAGSDRLEDIAYYEDRVRKFSDDQLSVPGSSYGRRLFNAAPGLNQIDGVVDELTKDPHSRRAAAVVWLPEDAVRASSDIPCTFGLFFHIRDGALTMTTVMRSNNAFTLLPYNFFEFSMVGEMIAAAVGVPFGRYIHWAASMHVFDNMKAPIDGLLSATERVSVEMPEMPSDNPLGNASRLAQLESKLRNASTITEVHAVHDLAVNDLPDYWLALFRVLYAYVLLKRELPEEARAVAAQLPDYFRSGVEDKIPATADDEVTPDEALIPIDDIEMAEPTRASAAASAIGGGDDVALEVARLLTEAGAVDGTVPTVREFMQVVEAIRSGRDQLRLAARDGAERSAAGPTAVSGVNVVEALRRVRRGDR